MEENNKWSSMGVKTLFFLVGIVLGITTLELGWRFTQQPTPTPAYDAPILVDDLRQIVQEAVATAVAAEMATPTAQQAATPTMSALHLPPVATPAVAAEMALPSGPLGSGEFQSGWYTEWYRSPFREVVDQLGDQVGTWETFAEPGVLLDDTAAFDHMTAPETPVLVPEGGFTYMAIGSVTLSHNGSNLLLPWKEENIYLIVIRGLPEGPDDRNQIVITKDYTRGAGIYSPMPAGAYTSLGWMIQQIEASFRSPNCGSGCRRATIVVVDLETNTYRAWMVNDPKSPRAWVPVVLD